MPKFQILAQNVLDNDLIVGDSLKSLVEITQHHAH